MRQLNIDLDDLALAFESGFEGMHHYLDLETGQVVAVSDDIWCELEELYAEIELEEGQEPPPLEQLLDARDLPDWQKQEPRQAYAVKAGYGQRFVAVPRMDPHEAYRDMEDFTATVCNDHVRELLEVAIMGRGAFRRFKNVLLRYPRERERRFAFQNARPHRRVLEWLESLGIVPTTEKGGMP
jgi:hypothetical protein